MTLAATEGRAQVVATTTPAESTTSWTVGPFFSSSIMHPETLGADFHWRPNMSAALSYGSFTYAPANNAKVQDMKVNITHYELVGAWQPWNGVFHVDGGLGQQTIKVTAKSSQSVHSSGTVTDSVADKLTLKADLGIVSTYLYTGCGWLWHWANGFMLGTGLGLQLPIASRSSFSANLEDSGVLDEAVKSTDAYGNLNDSVNKAAKTAGMLALPRIELVRVGWLF